MKYKGALSKPITKRRVGLLADEEKLRAEYQRQTDEVLSKLPDLFTVHEVPEGNWVALAIALARAHVPGFKIIERAGRPIEWGLADKAEFRLDVDTIVVNSGNKMPVTEAIKLACRLDAWADKTKPMTLAAITKHYYTADLRFVEVVKGARAWDALPPNERQTYESIVLTN